jgi:hypothetical protein
LRQISGARSHEQAPHFFLPPEGARPQVFTEVKQLFTSQPGLHAISLLLLVLPDLDVEGQLQRFPTAVMPFKPGLIHRNNIS